MCSNSTIVRRRVIYYIRRHCKITAAVRRWKIITLDKLCSVPSPYYIISYQRRRIDIRTYFSAGPIDLSTRTSTHDRISYIYLYRLYIYNIYYVILCARHKIICLFLIKQNYIINSLIGIYLPVAVYRYIYIYVAAANTK